MRANVQGAGRKVFIHSSFWHLPLLLMRKVVICKLFGFFLVNWFIQFTKPILMIFSGSWVGSIVQTQEHLRLKTLIHMASEDLWAYESCGCFYELFCIPLEVWKHSVHIHYNCMEKTNLEFLQNIFLYVLQKNKISWRWAGNDTLLIFERTIPFWHCTLKSVLKSDKMHTIGVFVLLEWWTYNTVKLIALTLAPVLCAFLWLTLWSERICFLLLFNMLCVRFWKVFFFKFMPAV